MFFRRSEKLEVDQQVLWVSVSSLVGDELSRRMNKGFSFFYCGRTRTEDDRYKKYRMLTAHRDNICRLSVLFVD